VAVEAGTVQQEVLIQRLDDAQQLLPEQEAPEGSRERLLDIQEGVLSIEEAEDRGGLVRHVHHCLRISHGIAQAHHWLSLDLGGERLDRPEPGMLVRRVLVPFAHPVFLHLHSGACRSTLTAFVEKIPRKWLTATPLPLYLRVASKNIR
jgi:hypothetical protein